jgi:NitT/TauT family transport system permease protein/taurine transport system permease protein
VTTAALGDSVSVTETPQVAELRGAAPRVPREHVGRKVWARGVQIARFLVLHYGAFVLAILVWTGLSHLIAGSAARAWVLPQPTAVFAETLRLINNGELPTYMQASMFHLLLGGSIGLVAGVVAGLGIALSQGLARFFYPLLSFFQSLGGIALAPLMIVWLGFSTLSVILVVDYTLFFPIAFSTLVGVRSVPPVYAQAVRTLGANRWSIIWGVLLPGAMPNILLGVKLALAYGWRSVVAVEMLFAINGLGYMIFQAQQSIGTAQIISGMIILGVIWILFEKLLVDPVEDLTIRRWGMVNR